MQQSELEVNLYGHSDPARRIRRGLCDAQQGIRLRYDINRQFAPYVGLIWTRRFAQATGASPPDPMASDDHGSLRGRHSFLVFSAWSWVSSPAAFLSGRRQPAFANKRLARRHPDPSGVHLVRCSKGKSIKVSIKHPLVQFVLASMMLALMAVADTGALICCGRYNVGTDASHSRLVTSLL